MVEPYDPWSSVDIDRWNAEMSALSTMDSDKEAQADPFAEAKRLRSEIAEIAAKHNATLGPSSSASSTHPQAATDQSFLEARQAEYEMLRKAAGELPDSDEDDFEELQKEEEKEDNPPS